MPAWVFHKPNQELRFLVKFFAEKEEAVARVSWLQGIKQKATVSTGMELAILTWGDGTIHILKAPSGCNGEIASVNRRISNVNLDQPPSQWALRLVDA